MTRLNDLRQKAHLSQNELAKRAGVSQAAISDIESGATRNPRIDTIRLIAKALDVPWHEILDDNPTTENIA